MRALQLCQQFIYKNTTIGEYIQGKQTGDGGEGEGEGRATRRFEKISMIREILCGLYDFL